jgi:hypothetical protein
MAVFSITEKEIKSTRTLISFTKNKCVGLLFDFFMLGLLAAPITIFF